MRMQHILLSIFVLSVLQSSIVVAASVPEDVETELSTLPDLNAAYIARLPRYDYTATKNQPAPGDAVSYQAVVANRGGQNTGTFAYTWYVDSILVLDATYPNLLPGESITLTLGWTWQDGPHKVRIELDPANLLAEVSEQNNSVEDQTNALAVGFWVEQSVYDWFNAHQVELGLGSVSWDDWAQRQIGTWNQMFEDARHPLTPQGVIERVRLDKVVILPDGTWRDCANSPSPEDRTVDLVWGFPSELVGVDKGRHCPPFNFYMNNPQFQNFEPPLIHEMSHARYLIDLYGLNVYVNATRLSVDASSTASTLSVDRDIEGDGNFPLPAHLSVGGELIVCESKVGTTFVRCSRGEEGTVPRTHSAGDLVNLATVRLQDGHRNLIQGSSELPLMGFDDHLYYNRYPDDLMSGGLRYEQHSAYALNRIAGRRPICGNYNAPCNIGEYLNDIPDSNSLEIRNLSGEPIAGARVEVYQASPFPIWYGKFFDKSPDIVRFTDAEGRASLGPHPFGRGESIIHGYGYSNAVVLLKIASGGASTYRFFEVTEVNEAYWSGHENSAVYPITADLPQGSIPSYAFLPAILRDFSPPQPLLVLQFEGGFSGADGEPGNASGVTFAPGHSGQGALFDNGDTLYYDTNDNIDRERGHLEFWLKPLWNGNDYHNYSFFEVGNTWFNRMRITKDGANNFRFLLWSSNTEYGVHHNVSDWRANEWHHIKVSWQDDTISLSIDGVLCDTQSSIVLPDHLAPTMYIGSASFGDMQAQAVIDDFAIYARR